MFHRVPGNWCETTKTQQHFLKSGRQDDTLSSGTRKLVRGDDSQLVRTRLDFHNVQISDHRYLAEVFKNLRQKLNLAEAGPVLDLKTNVLIWGLFLSTTMKTAVHLGPNYKDNLEVYRNTSFAELKNLFDITQRLILEHEAENSESIID